MKKRIYDILLVLIAGALIFYYSQKPIYNWDMIAYMGIVVEYSEHDMHKMHDKVYGTLKQETPADIYSTLTADIEDRHDCLVNDQAFEDELEYFRVKPLYTGMVYLLYKAGVHLVTATLVPSYITSFLILLLVYAWLLLYVKRPWAIMITIILALYPPFIEIVQLSTPDAMSNLFILLSLYLIARNNTRYWLPLCLVLAIVGRVDNFIFAGVVTYFLYMHGKKNVLLLSAVFGVIGIVSILLIPVLMGDRPDWFTKFAYVSSTGNYVQHWRDVIFLFRHSVYDILFVATGIFLFIKSTGITRRIMGIVALTVGLHMLLFPSLQERFLVAYEFTLIMMAVKYLAEKYPLMAEQKLRALTL